ncbi:unnamed protein product [Schistocephalus solidus]|uniref:Secreted protein n=1 Tax=Schistocephalus solidus TaxID=70667 RepID=A0A183SA39_SCHSO|nr:unnamed protein product [Schistocephalus solidus]
MLDLPIHLGALLLVHSFLYQVAISEDGRPVRIIQAMEVNFVYPVLDEKIIAPCIALVEPVLILTLWVTPGGGVAGVPELTPLSPRCPNFEKVELAAEEVSVAAKTQSANPDLAGDDLDVLRKHRLEKLSPKHSSADEVTVSPELRDSAKESDKPPLDDGSKTD